MDKCIVFGLGTKFYFGLYYIRKNYEIIAYTDNSLSARIDWSHSGEFTGEKIIEPKDIKKYDKSTKILITVGDSKAKLSITEQLFNEGIEKKQIIYLREERIGRFVLDSLFFKPSLSLNEMKELFSYNCEHITIETNSACNRKCWFCPNSILDRHSENIKMKNEIFEKIINELKEINYNGVITYSFYNEPLLDDFIEEKIKFVKNQLPYCKQLITTNGDYLSESKLLKLCKAGLDYLIISVYGPNDYNKVWNLTDAKEEIERIVKKTDINITCRVNSDFVVIWYGKKKNCYIRLQNYDFKTVGHNRGEILSDELPLKKICARDEVCANPFVTFNVYYNGIVSICGNMREDYQKHFDFMIGNVKDNSIFEIWASEKAYRFRKTFINNINSYPCSSCSRVGGIYDTFIPIYPGTKLHNRPRYIRESDNL